MADAPSASPLPKPPIQGPPPWVYVFGTVLGVLIVSFVLLHLAGGGLGQHLHQP